MNIMEQEEWDLETEKESKSLIFISKGLVK
jgi:hypothetical protein